MQIAGGERPGPLLARNPPVLRSDCAAGRRASLCAASTSVSSTWPGKSGLTDADCAPAAGWSGAEQHRAASNRHNPGAGARVRAKTACVMLLALVALSIATSVYRALTAHGVQASLAAHDGSIESTGAYEGWTAGWAHWPSFFSEADLMFAILLAASVTVGHVRPFLRATNVLYLLYMCMSMWMQRTATVAGFVATSEDSATIPAQTHYLHAYLDMSTASGPVWACLTFSLVVAGSLHLSAWEQTLWCLLHPLSATLLSMWLSVPLSALSSLLALWRSGLVLLAVLWLLDVSVRSHKMPQGASAPTKASEQRWTAEHTAVPEDSSAAAAVASAGPARSVGPAPVPAPAAAAPAPARVASPSSPAGAKAVSTAQAAEVVEARPLSSGSGLDTPVTASAAVPVAAAAAAAADTNAADAARALARTRARFIAAMSHEVRTPLNGLLGLLDALLETPSLDEYQRQLVHGIYRCARVVLTLSTQALQYTRYTQAVPTATGEPCPLPAGAAPEPSRPGTLATLVAPLGSIQPRAFSLRAVLDGAGQAVAAAAAARGVSVSVSTAPEVPDALVGVPEYLLDLVMKMLDYMLRRVEDGTGRARLRVVRAQQEPQTPVSSPGAVHLRIFGCDNATPLTDEELAQGIQPLMTLRALDEGQLLACGADFDLATAAVVASWLGGTLEFGRRPCDVGLRHILESNVTMREASAAEIREVELRSRHGVAGGADDLGLGDGAMLAERRSRLSSGTRSRGGRSSSHCGTDSRSDSLAVSRLESRDRSLTASPTADLECGASGCKAGGITAAAGAVCADARAAPAIEAPATEAQATGSLSFTPELHRQGADRMPSPAPFAAGPAPADDPAAPDIDPQQLERALLRERRRSSGRLPRTSLALPTWAPEPAAQWTGTADAPLSGVRVSLLCDFRDTAIALSDVLLRAGAALPHQLVVLPPSGSAPRSEAHAQQLISALRAHEVSVTDAHVVLVSVAPELLTAALPVLVQLQRADAPADSVRGGPAADTGRAALVVLAPAAAIGAVQSQLEGLGVTEFGEAGAAETPVGVVVSTLLPTREIVHVMRRAWQCTVRRSAPRGHRDRPQHAKQQPQPQPQPPPERQLPSARRPIEASAADGAAAPLVPICTPAAATAAAASVSACEPSFDRASVAAAVAGAPSSGPGPAPPAALAPASDPPAPVTASSASLARPPLAARASNAATAVTFASAPETMALAAGDRRALIVEDNKLNVMVLQRLLRKLNLESDVAGDGAEALRRLSRTDSDCCDAGSGLQAHERSRYAVVMMDLHMPGVDGLEATRRLRQLERERGWARTPVVAVTASVAEGIRQTCLEVGMDGFISKPVTLPVLTRELERCSVVRSAKGSAAPKDEERPT